MHTKDEQNRPSDGYNRTRPVVDLWYLIDFWVEKEKVYFFFSQLSRKSIFPPLTLKLDKSPLLTFQTVYFIFLERFWRRFCYSDDGIVFFFSLIISTKSLKNYNKSQENYKIENPILLDST